MYKRPFWHFQPEQEPNNEPEVDNMHVSQPNANTNVVGSLLGQREIKFRLWLPSIRKMTHSLSIKDWANGYEQITISDDCIWMQYTGLKDKNGKEIYEGDIVKNFNCGPHTVVYENGAFGYVINNDEDFPYFISFAGNNNFRWQDNFSDRIEIIGNIFENPELLETLR